MAETHLILVRHATAEDNSESGRDEDRVLTSVGTKHANIVSQSAKDLNFPAASHVITSGFLRARQTRQCFDWLNCEETHTEIVSPWGNLGETEKLLIQLSEDQKSCIWIFSHNPFLSQFLKTYAPNVFAAVGRFRKSDCIWLRWRNEGSFLARSPDLKGFLSKPS
jgi:phosphohistidine phosphatase SixA